MRLRHTEVALNGYRFCRPNFRSYCRLAASLLIVAIALFLVGCGGLSGGNPADPNSVSLGSSTVSFGTVAVGGSTAVPDSIANNTSASVTVSSITGTGSGFQITGLSLPLTLAAGQTAPFSVQFQPTAPGTPSVTISFFDQNAQSLVSLNASATAVTAGVLSLNPEQIAFGSVVVGSSQPTAVTLSNTGGSDLSVNQATLSGAGFTMGNLGLPLTLHPGDSTQVTITFAPPDSGSFSGSVTFATTSDQVPGTVVLNFSGSGTALAQGTLTPSLTSLAFGSVEVSDHSDLSETLTNTGGSAVTISQATASGAGFSVSGLSLPVTVAVNKSVTFTVTFAPANAGAASGNVSIVSDASDANLSIPLSGTGVAAGALASNPSSFSFGNVQDGNTKQLSGSLTNTGQTSLTITAADASGPGFSLNGLTLPLTLTAGQSTPFTVLFNPTVSGAASGNVSITSDGSNPKLNIPLSGTGVTPGALSPNPASLAFGSVQVGNSSNLSETLTNTGGASVTISQVNLSGAAFSVSGLTLPVTLTPNGSVTFTATFTPTSAGAASGSLSVVSNASNSPLGIALAGTGTVAGELAVTPATLSFGNVAVGSNSALNGSLNATGAAVTVTSATLNNSEFALSGISLPVTIPAGQSATFTVTFTPQSSGATSASLSFSSNAGNSPTVEKMTGTGTAPDQHTVDLTWDASVDAVGYNVYRGTVSGGPYSVINSTLDGTTAYTDNTVVSGQTYYYVTTAVDGKGNESGYSNQTQAIIPNP